MIDDLQKIWVVDLERVSSDVIEGLNTGRVQIFDGVAYWAKRSGKRGIVQHLPFKESLIKQGADLATVTQTIQATTMVAVGVSTCLIIGALVIQTRYLAAKIDKLQEAIDLVSLDVHAQNVIFYMDKISAYFGAIEMARVLLLDRDLKDEVRDIAAPLLVEIGSRRNQLFSFLDNILSVAAMASKRHYELIVDFVHAVLDLLPKAVFIERELYARIDKSGVAGLITEESAKRYHSLLEMYKSWCNIQYRAGLRQGSDSHAFALVNREAKIAQLFQSRENQLLLPLAN